jgi:hypothetical protein
MSRKIQIESAMVWKVLKKGIQGKVVGVSSFTDVLIFFKDDVAHLMRAKQIQLDQTGLK